MIYVSKCRLFMISHTGAKDYKLSYSGPPYEIVGEFPSLRGAKEAANDLKALRGC